MPPAGLTRNLGRARDAFEGRDVTQLRAAHAPPRGGASLMSGDGGGEPGHSSAWDVTRGVAQGALEGVAASGALVAVGVVLGLAPGHAARLLSGGAAALATAAALRSYILARLAAEIYARERAREVWELANNPDGEVTEMEELYTARGMTPADAKRVVAILASYPSLLIETMMAEELHLAPPEATPLKHGAPLLVAACAAAAHPLLPLWAVGTPVSSLLTLAWRHALAPDTLWRGQLAAIAAVALLVARTLRGALASAKVWLPLLLCAALAVAALACAGAV